MRSEKGLANIVIRDRKRSRRKISIRNRVESIARTSQSKLAIEKFEYPEDVARLRPHTRAECERGARPCPFVSCRYHLFLDVNPQNGSIKFNFPGWEPSDLKFTCALDIAEKGGLSSESVGALVNLTRERIRQIELGAVEKISPTLSQHCASDKPNRPKKRLPLLNSRNENPNQYKQIDNGDRS